MLIKSNIVYIYRKVNLKKEIEYIYIHAYKHTFNNTCIVTFMHAYKLTCI